MLPYLKREKEVSVSSPSEKVERKADEPEDMDYLEQCAGELMEALKSGDKKAVARELKAFFEIADALPHEEGDHI